MGATRNAPQKKLNWVWGLAGLSATCFVALLIYLTNMPIDTPVKGVQSGKTEQQQNVSDQLSKKPKESSINTKNIKEKHQFEFYSVLPERKLEVDYNIDNSAFRPLNKPLIKNKPSIANDTKTLIAKDTKTVIKIKKESDHKDNKKTIEKKIPSPSINPSPYQLQGGVFSEVAKTELRKLEFNQKESKKIIEKKSPSPSTSLSLYQLQVGAFSKLAKADTRKIELAFMGIESNIQVIYSQGKKMYRLRVGPTTDKQHIKRIQKKLQSNNVSTFIHKLKDA